MEWTIVFWIWTLVIWIISIAVAIWQWFLSKEQLDQAKNTNQDTKRLLDSISERITKIESLSNETRTDVKEQISKMIDKNDENFKELLRWSKEIDQNELMKTLLPSLLQDPDTMRDLMNAWNVNQ